MQIFFLLLAEKYFMVEIQKRIFVREDFFFFLIVVWRRNIDRVLFVGSEKTEIDF